MGKINWGRVLLGGLVAGVVINVVEYVLNNFVLAEQWAAALKALGGVQLRPHANEMFIVNGFLFGIATIWAYAVARPRYGAGAKTAVIVALGVWFIGDFLVDFGIWAAGLFHGRLLAVAACVGLIEIIIASVAGAALYKEP